MTLNEQQGYLQDRFVDNLEVQKYLIGRGFNSATCSEFGAGYCPLDCPVELSPFRGRITFPIYDLSGDTAGFGGRLFGRTEGPKWINPSDSENYRKSKILYNLWAAQDHIIREGYVVVVEGYFGVMRLWQEGLKNVVATCGTAFTVPQLRLLKRFADKVVLLYDGDESGQNATHRVLELLKQERFEIAPVFLPGGMDPDDFVLNFGIDELRGMIK